MKRDKLKPALQRGLYVITDCVNLDTSGLLRKSRLILEAGVAVLQYRDKTPDAAIRMERALALQKLCTRYNTVFLINDDVELAVQVGADGVHIGREDAGYDQSRALLGRQALIGVSCYNQLERALLAEHQGADYAAFGAFYPTATKTTEFRAHPDLLIRAKRRLAIPVVAIGGITPENAAVLIGAGADLLAVVNSVYSREDPQQAVAEYNILFNKTSSSE